MFQALDVLQAWVGSHERPLKWKLFELAIRLTNTTKLVLLSRKPSTVRSNDVFKQNARLIAQSTSAHAWHQVASSRFVHNFLPSSSPSMCHRCLFSCCCWHPLRWWQNSRLRYFFFIAWRKTRHGWGLAGTSSKHKQQTYKTSASGSKPNTPVAL